MSTMASQITNISTVCSAVCSCAHQIEVRVTGLCEGNPPVNPTHKRLVTRKMFPFHDVILISDNDIHVDRSNKDLLWNFTFIFRFLEAKMKNKFLHKTRIPIFTQCWEELCISYYISLFFFLRTNELSEEQWFCASFQSIFSYHDDVIKWKHFPRYWPFVRGNYRSPVTALMFSLICALNKQLSKQSWDWWFETPSYLLWRHCNVMQVIYLPNREKIIYLTSILFDTWAAIWC